MRSAVAGTGLRLDETTRAPQDVMNRKNTKVLPLQETGGDRSVMSRWASSQPNGAPHDMIRCQDERQSEHTKKRRHSTACIKEP